MLIHHLKISILTSLTEPSRPESWCPLANFYASVMQSSSTPLIWKADKKRHRQLAVLGIIISVALVLLAEVHLDQGILCFDCSAVIFR
jgi:hypothetical protein